MCLSCVCYILHDDASYLAASMQSFAAAGKVFAFVSRVPWHDVPGDWQAAAQIAQDAGAEVVLGEWRFELEHRQFALACLREKGYTHALIPDGDEIIEPALLHALTHIAEAELAERVYAHWDTYWKTPEYVIRPREPFTPCLLLDLRVAVPTGLRNFDGGRSLLLPPEYGLVHHLSYVGPDSRIRRKLATWGHKHEVLPRRFMFGLLGLSGLPGVLFLRKILLILSIFSSSPFLLFYPFLPIIPLATIGGRRNNCERRVCIGTEYGEEERVAAQQ